MTIAADSYNTFLSNTFDRGGSRVRNVFTKYNEVDSDSEVNTSHFRRSRPGDAYYKSDDINFGWFGRSVLRHKVNSGDPQGFKYGMRVGVRTKRELENFKTGRLYNAYIGKGESVYNVSNYFESGSRNVSEGLYDTDLKTFDQGAIKKYFENDNLVSAYNKIYQQAAQYKKSGGTETKLTMDFKIGKDGQGSVTYQLRDHNNKPIGQPVVADISKQDMKNASKMQAAQWVVDESGGGYAQKAKVFYKLLNDGNVNDQQLDAVMRLGLLSNDLSTADRSAIILNRVVNV